MKTGKANLGDQHVGIVGRKGTWLGSVGIVKSNRVRETPNPRPHGPATRGRICKGPRTAISYGNCTYSVCL